MKTDGQDQALRLEVITPDHALWDEATSQVNLRYRKAFDARLCAYMPAFMALMQGEHILSLCGYHCAEDGPMFLEQYLDMPAERALSKEFGCSVARKQLIEFGQLASFANGLSPLHFYLMTEKLVSLGYEWCIFTATDPLYALMKRLGLQPVVIAEADPTCIPDANRIWGRYYEYQPRVFAGNLKTGLARLHILNLRQKRA